jgi:glycosyltransferase involved in cell wall biosynthesis
VMSALDVYVHSALRPEPFGRVLVEAMGAGKPVIAPDAGGVPEIVEHGRTGLLFQPCGVEALAHAIVSLLRDEARRDAMGEAALQVARRKFTVEEYVRQVEGLYTELLEVGT